MKKIKIGIIGLGYVGLPLALSFCSKRNVLVYGFDIDTNKLSNLISGKSYIKHVSNKDIKKKINKNFFVYDEFEKIKELDFIVFCLPTPLTNKKVPDLSYISYTLKKIFKYLRKNQTLSLESSTYPGTTKEIIINKLNSKFNIGKNFFVVYSPEREDPGSKFKLEKIPKIVSGYSKKCLIKAKKFYGLIFKELVSVSSLETAEMTKLLENIYRSVNIGLINEMKMISETFNVNIYEIIKAANTKPFGFQAFYPGPGVGGHCIPVDPFYLTWKAKKLGINTKFIKIAGKINDEITNWIIDKVNLIIKKKRKKLLVIGVAYKKNVDDYRESPILKIINKLEKRENIVDYYDPFIPVIKKTRKYNFNKRSSKLNFKKLSQYDAVIVGTDHDIIDYNNLRKYSKLIIDLRGRYSSIKAKKIICL